RVHMLGQDILDSIAAQRLTASIYEDGFGRLAMAFPQPMAQGGNDFLAQRDAPCLAPFPGATNMRAPASNTTSWQRIAMSSETRSPVCNATSSSVRSRRPDHVV